MPADPSAVTHTGKQCSWNDDRAAAARARAPGRGRPRQEAQSRSGLSVRPAGHIVQIVRQPAKPFRLRRVFFSPIPNTTQPNLARVEAEALRRRQP